MKFHHSYHFIILISFLLEVFLSVETGIGFASATMSKSSNALFSNGLELPQTTRAVALTDKDNVAHAETARSTGSRLFQATTHHRIFCAIILFYCFNTLCVRYSI